MVTTTTKRRMQYVTFNLVSIVLITLLVAKVECLRTNSMGTQFVVAFLQNEQASATTSIFVSAYTTTNVKIYSQRSGFSTLSYTIAAGTVKYVALGSNFLSTTASYTTYYIEADQLVTVSAINQQTATTDAFLVYPIDIPDPTSFRVLSYTSSLGYPSVLGIVATQSNTIVSISYSSTAGISSPTSIALNQYQGIEIGSTGDLTGTLITSNYPIVVFGGNLCTNVPSSVTYCDHIVEQMMPTSTWGKSFYTVPVPTRKSYDVFRAVAHLDQTSIYINDVFQKTINAGQYYEFQRSSTSYSKISADKIVSLAQYCVGTSADGILSDPFMTVVPPAEQYLSSYLVNTPVGGTSFSNYLSVIVDSQYSSGLLLDGNTLSMSWNQIGSTSYVGASIALTAGSHSITHKLPVVQFGVLLTGFNSAESYGYAGGLRLSPIAVECVKTTTVIDDGIDNDCDGRIDEEYLNGIDEDGDGLIDEDLVSAPNCDDGNACTYDYFDGSHCQHSTITCNDGNGCTSDSCNTATGCVYTPLTGTSCSDGNACTTNDYCSAGTCYGNAITCYDGNECTSDSCNTASGCVYTPLTGTSCSDGNACTANDYCSAGTCYSGSAVTCNDGNQCTSDSCNTATGCVYTPLTGTSCSDGNACTANDYCSAGACYSGSAVICNDGNQCTSDSCNTATGCVYTPLTGVACSDGNACTANDYCSAGTCYSGSAVICNDGNECTSDSCNTATGCVYNPLTGTSCSDGSVCTVDDRCSSGSCIPGSPLPCDDSVYCTVDTCNAITGCHHTAVNANCDDFIACTTNICDLKNDCQYIPVDSECSDGIACTVDTCDVVKGCVFTPVNSNCDDHLFCTDDFCNPNNGCEYVTYNSRCNDYDQCTTDICTVGSGCSNTFESVCLITFTINDVTMKEGTGANTNFIFTVSNSQNSSVALKVYLSTVDGTAIAGSDYIALSNYEITFPPYTREVNVPVVVIGDSLFEGNNTFYLKMVDARSSQPMIEFNIESIGVGTILNDDNPSLTNDVYYVGQKALLSVNQTNGLFSNDNVELGDNPYAIARVGDSTRNGTLELHNNGSFSYKTSLCYIDDRFTYYVKDVDGNIYYSSVLIVANLCQLSTPTLAVLYYPVVIAWFDLPFEAANEVSFYLRVTDKNGVEVNTESWDDIKPRGTLPATSMIWNPASVISGDVYNLTLISEPNSLSWNVYPQSFIPIPFAGYNRHLCACSN